MNKQKQTVKNNNKISGYFFLALRAGLPFIISTVIGLMTKLWWIGWFIYIPIHELLRPFVEYPFAKFLKFRKMPQKELFGKNSRLSKSTCFTFRKLCVKAFGRRLFHSGRNVCRKKRKHRFFAFSLRAKKTI